jgi:hypothetical protein
MEARQMARALLITNLFFVIACSRSVAAEITCENPRVRAVLSESAVWQSLVVKATGEDCCATEAQVPLATVRIDDKTLGANRARLDGQQLTVGFAGCDTQLIYRIDVTDDWIVFQLEQIIGTRPAQVTLLAVGVTITEHGGRRLNAAWNDQTAVCLRAINLQTEGMYRRQKKIDVLSAVAQDAPGPPLEGCGAALIVAPPAELKPILSRLARTYDLPHNESNGVASRDLPIARQSYWFLRFGEQDVDRVIDYCRRTGFRQVMMDSGSWCTSVGHFTFDTNTYPDGIESLRRTVARLHDQGILVGMHTFASKVSKTDAYVTPVPNRGFCVDRTAELAEDVDAAAAQIRTASDLSQWPGSPVCRQQVWEGHVSKHQEVVIDDEIVRYESIGPEGQWNTFLGCQRGAWGTHAASHARGTACRHWAVDGCINGYILDQELPLFQETTSRLADIFNHCDFDMVYFDGSEDVDRRRFHYYSSQAHAVAMRKFAKRPLVHMGGGFTHGLWHSYTRSGTVDQYPGTYLAHLQAGGKIERWPTCKDHIDRSVRGVLACRQDMTPGELGWFGIGPKSGRYDGLQYDEIEYLMCKSLAYDAPISLQASFARLQAHRLTDDILEIVRQYEELRLADSVPEQAREPLRELGRDFVLLPAGLRSADCPAEFVSVGQLPQVAGTHDVRAFVGSVARGAVATLWHYTGRDGRLVLDMPELQAFDVSGRSVVVPQADGQSVLPIDQRRLLVFAANASLETLRGALATATLELRKPEILWLQAEDFVARQGSLTTGAQAGVPDADAWGDFLVCPGAFDRSGQTADYCEYRLQIPRAGRWTLWARVRYPTGGDMSFGLVLPADAVTLTGDQVLGNCGANDGGWHWTGRGGGVTTVPPGAPIAFDLQPGPFVFRVYPREGSGRAPTNPRLDCFCLSEDPAYVPSDQDALAVLGRQP